MTSAASPSQARTAWIITYTPAGSEPRVLRQARSLVEAGWRVVICGYGDRQTVPDPCEFVQLANNPASGRLASLAQRTNRDLGLRLARADLPAETARRLVVSLHHNSFPNWRRDHLAILKAAAERPGLSPSLVIAHDYPTCPPAHDLARRYKAPLIVDSHEYMLGALPENAQWVREQRPVIKVIQDRYFGLADQVMTVSEGIADQLNSEQALKRPVLVLRNAPPYVQSPFRPTSGAINVLYHGLLSPYRDLDLAIGAAALWRPEYRLTLRGPGDPDYLRHLRAMAAELGVEDRVSIEEPVSHDKLIESANRADIGLFAYRAGSPQRTYTLPNKFFEYVMAGLALAVSDLPEMTRLVQRHALGLVVGDATPASLASSIDSLTPERIDALKQASLAAARELSWDTEQAGFLAIVNELCRAP